MKNTFLLLLLFSSVFAKAQSLKDALFSGKLKNQPGTVIRKGDDLASKMDTTYKVPAGDTAKATTATTAQTTPVSVAQAQPDLSTAATDNKVNASPSSDTTAVATTAEPAEATDAPKEAAPPKPKDNNAILKEYMNGFAETLKAEVLSSKKVKKGDYFVQVSYVIEPDGKITVNDIYVDPENPYLQQQIKDRLASSDMPQLKPVLNSAGVPRKVNKKYNFTLTKES